MRRLVAKDGSRWDVLAGRESWGANVLLFVPSGDGDIRQVIIDAQSVDEASARIDAMTDDELLSLLNRSKKREE